MGILSLIVIIFVGWWILREIAERTPERRIAKAEELAEVFLQSYAVTGKVSFGRSQEEKELIRMRDWYTRLKERHKYDKPKLLQIAEDWKDYAFNLSHLDTTKYLYLESQDDEESDGLYKEGREASLKIEEIENRFANMLGPSCEKELRDARETEKRLREEPIAP